MARYINVLNFYINYIAYGKEVGRAFYKSVAHLGYVKKSVVMNTDVDEAAERGYVSYSALKLHIGLEVLDFKNVA